MLQPLHLLKWKAFYPTWSLPCHYLQPEAVLTYLKVPCTPSALWPKPRLQKLPCKAPLPVISLTSLGPPFSRDDYLLHGLEGMVKISMVLEDTQRHASGISVVTALDFFISWVPVQSPTLIPESE